MTAITVFPAIRNVLYSGDNLISMTPAPTNAAGVISAGMIVAHAAAGVSMTVGEARGNTPPFGVALYDSSGTAASRISIAGPGCVVYVANDDSTRLIDAGDYCLPSSTFNGAATSLAAGAIYGGSMNGFGASALGIFLDDVAGGGTGKVLICPMVLNAGM
jgi:hypothetical protein